MHILNPELLSRIQDMGKKEQKQLLDLIIANKTKNLLSSLKPELTDDGQIEDTKDDLVFLVFAALENNVPRETVFAGTYNLWMALKEYGREKRKLSD